MRTEEYRREVERRDEMLAAADARIAELEAALRDMVGSGGVLCSIGSENSHYELQVRRKVVESARAALAGAGLAPSPAPGELPCAWCGQVGDPSHLGNVRCMMCARLVSPQEHERQRLVARDTARRSGEGDAEVRDMGGLLALLEAARSAAGRGYRAATHGHLIEAAEEAALAYNSIDLALSLELGQPSEPQRPDPCPPLPTQRRPESP